MNSIEPKPKTNEDSLWLIACFLITAIAIFWRFYQLELRPLHHDEGVNGFFLKTLFTEGVYKYDPSNYHGPTLYYWALACAKVWGLTTTSIRASTAIFGVLVVAAAFLLKSYIGRIGSLAAALFLALSPGMVFISRYFIHEILFIFFSFGIAITVWYFMQKRKAGNLAVAATLVLLLICFVVPALDLAKLIAGNNLALLWIMRAGLFALEAVLVFFFVKALLNWQDGRPIYLLLASANASLLFATKETAFITIGTMGLACLCTGLWCKIHNTISGENQNKDSENAELTWANFRVGLGASRNFLFIAAAAAFVFAYLGVLFFSSFFTYSDGVSGAFKAYSFWTKTGSNDHMQNGFWAYLKWGLKIESPILVLSAIGTLIALYRPRNRFAIFAGFWAWGIFLAYTLIPYKTPWLALSFLLPMCVVAGFGMNELFSSRQFPIKVLGGVLTTLAAVVLSYQTYDLNFVRYDDDTMPYVYAHTQRGFSDLTKKIEQYADKSGKGKNTAIEIISPEYWPLPWSLRDYPKALFHGIFINTATSEMILADRSQVPELSARYGARYKYAGTYPLRPGVELFLLVRRDIADAEAKEIFTIGFL